MRNHDLDAGDEARGWAVAANGAVAIGHKRRKRRSRWSWSVDEKARVARESLASAETITAVFERHRIPRNRLSSWRTQLRRGQLAAATSAQAEPDAEFAAVEAEAAPSAVIGGRGVTVRLEGVGIGPSDAWHPIVRCCSLVRVTSVGVVERRARVLLAIRRDTTRPQAGPGFAARGWLSGMAVVHRLGAGRKRGIAKC